MIVSRVSGLEINIVDWYGRLLELGSIRYTCRGINNNIYIITIALLCLHFVRNWWEQYKKSALLFVNHISKNSSEWFVYCDDGLFLQKFNINARSIFPIYMNTQFIILNIRSFLTLDFRSLLLKQWDVLGYKRKHHKSHPKTHIHIIVWLSIWSYN